MLVRAVAEDESFRQVEGVVIVRRDGDGFGRLEADALNVARRIARGGVESEGQRVAALLHRFRLSQVGRRLVPALPLDAKGSVGHGVALLRLQAQVDGDAVIARVGIDGHEVVVHFLLVLQGKGDVVAVAHPLQSVASKMLMGVFAGNRTHL